MVISLPVLLFLMYCVLCESCLYIWKLVGVRFLLKPGCEGGNICYSLPILVSGGGGGYCVLCESQG